MDNMDINLSIPLHDWTVKKETPTPTSTKFNHSFKTNLSQKILSVHNVWNSSDLARILYDFTAMSDFGI